jgi:hypothetical protein
MKTKEEIEKLAEKLYPISPNPNQIIEGFERVAFKKGYILSQEDMNQKLYEFGKLVLDTFHSEGKTHSGEERLPRVKFDEWFNGLNKKD